MKLRVDVGKICFALRYDIYFFIDSGESDLLTPNGYGTANFKGLFSSLTTLSCSIRLVSYFCQKLASERLNMGFCAEIGSLCCSNCEKSILIYL